MIPKGFVLPKGRNCTGGSEDWVGLDKGFPSSIEAGVMTIVKGNYGN